MPFSDLSFPIWSGKKRDWKVS